MRRRFQWLLSAALLAGLAAGSASAKPLAPAVSQRQPPQRNAGNLPAGPFAVAVVSTNPIISVQPGPGKLAGAFRGMAQGRTESESSPLYLVLGNSGEGRIGATIGGAFAGAMSAPSKKDQRAAADALVESLRRAQLPSKILAAVSAAAQPHLETNLVRIEPGALDAVADRDSFYLRRELTAALEVESIELGLQDSERAGEVRLFLAARTVLRDLRAKEIAHAMAWRYVGVSGPQAFAAHYATPNEAERLAGKFATDLAEEIFLRALPEFAGVNYGIEIVEPKPERSNSAAKTGLRPTFKWAAFAPSAALGDVKDVTYELRIWTPRPGYEGAALVYSREGITECEHRIDTMLNPKVTHLWSVRAVFTRNGRKAVSSWSYVRKKKDSEERIPGPIRFDLLHRFTTDINAR